LAGKFYLQASGNKGLVFNLSEHVSQKVLVQLCLLLFQDNLLKLKREVVGIASLDVALEHVMCDESHGVYMSVEEEELGDGSDESVRGRNAMQGESEQRKEKKCNNI
jgi:hypothetical protein